MAVQGLWAVPWLMEVNGFERAVAAQHLLVMGVTMLVGYLALGLAVDASSRVAGCIRGISSAPASH